MQRIILASASPRRHELMSRIGLTFDVEISEIDEDMPDGVEPAWCVRDLAHRKAAAVAGKHREGIVIGADTIVVSRGRILGKPTDATDARQMLGFLSGAEHEVLTGVAVIDTVSRKSVVEHELTRVVFKKLTPEEIDGYVASGEPLDKAGAYGIQELGALLVKEIHGCYFNVVGLPVAKLADMLKLFGIELLAGLR